MDSFNSGMWCGGVGSNLDPCIENSWDYQYHMKILIQKLMATFSLTKDRIEIAL